MCINIFILKFTFIDMKILKPHTIVCTDKIVGFTIYESKSTNASINDVIWWTLYIVFPIYTEYTFYLFTCI
jgi:hypothetical protein